MRCVIALGGNALLRRSERPDASVQRHHVRFAAAQLAPIVADNEEIICHGNGRQIGVLALESADDSHLSEPFPLDALGAQTQGMIGYWLGVELGNAGVAPDTAGWRRVVASPEPRPLIEMDLIERMAAAGDVVLCGGGGGVPVVRRDGALHGVEAVVDKDVTAALLAIELDAD